jgi:hypothetical protein
MWPVGTGASPKRELQSLWSPSARPCSAGVRSSRKRRIQLEAYWPTGKNAILSQKPPGGRFGLVLMLINALSRKSILFTILHAILCHYFGLPRSKRAGTTVPATRTFFP